MKICVSCNHRFEAPDWRCPKCCYVPARVAGIPVFAPLLAHGNDGFKSEYFEELADLEAGHFWFRNRNRLIQQGLREHFPNARRFLEIGCGTGFVLTGIKNDLPDLKLAGSELFLTGLTYARSRLPGVPLYQMDALRIPFIEEFDVVGAFDVLEHIAEDERVLAQMWQAINLGGGLMITVPQHPSLWSVADERACHKRRYTRRELVGKVQAAGFKVRRVTSFVSLLLPLFWLSRRRQNQMGKDAPNAEYQMSLTTNRLLDLVLHFEAWLLRLGFNFPAGGSLFLVAQKTANSHEDS